MVVTSSGVDLVSRFFAVVVWSCCDDALMVVAVELFGGVVGIAFPEVGVLV